MRRTELVLQGFDERSRDYSMKLDCLDLMGRAMLAVGEHELAQRYWELNTMLLITKVAVRAANSDRSSCQTAA